jgi:hypothetical protein
MLEFTKISYASDDFSNGSSEVKTMFAITKEGTTMIALRLIDMKSYRIVFHIDGTVGMLGERVNMATKLSNSDFRCYSEIQFASITTDLEANYDI